MRCWRKPAALLRTVQGKVAPVSVIRQGRFVQNLMCHGYDVHPSSSCNVDMIVVREFETKSHILKGMIVVIFFGYPCCGYLALRSQQPLLLLFS